ncbi:MAG: hypothetical protein KY455_07170 [Euryarchaeota archaeon]|nr:hypothetical protein [Euryarchaeota archaeon]
MPFATLTVVALFFVAAFAPMGLGQGASAPRLGSVDAPAEVTLLSGGARKVPITVHVADRGAGLASIEVELIKHGRTYAAVDLEPGNDPLVWTGNLSLKHTTPAGLYRLETVASDGVRGMHALSQDVEILPLAALGTLETSVSFGETGPNGWLGPAKVTYRNLGNVPLAVALTASPFIHEDGDAEIMPEHLEVRVGGDPLGRAGEPITLAPLSVGSGGVLELWLYVPSGSSQYVPPGEYTGTVDLSSEGVS